MAVKTPFLSPECGWGKGGARRISGKRKPLQGRTSKGFVLAGAVGFEPTVHDTKNRCLTTWPRPISVCGAENSALFRQVQPSILILFCHSNIFLFFVRFQAVARSGLWLQDGAAGKFARLHPPVGVGLGNGGGGRIGQVGIGIEAKAGGPAARHAG